MFIDHDCNESTNTCSQLSITSYRISQPIHKKSPSRKPEDCLDPYLVYHYCIFHIIHPGRLGEVCTLAKLITFVPASQVEDREIASANNFCAVELTKNFLRNVEPQPQPQKNLRKRMTPCTNIATASIPSASSLRRIRQPHLVMGPHVISPQVPTFSIEYFLFFFQTVIFENSTPRPSKLHHPSTPVRRCPATETSDHAHSILRTSAPDDPSPLATNDLLLIIAVWHIRRPAPGPLHDS